MKEYFKNLKEHPGIGTATLFTIMFMFAGMSNKSFQNPLHGMLFGLACSSLIWIIILISNINRGK
jgi:hypothetical protein